MQPGEAEAACSIWGSRLKGRGAVVE
jgi:hypothetical protein